MADTASRMKEALIIRGLKQADIVERTQIGKSSISTYLRGRYDPKQKNLHLIAKALDVNPAWLMGEDVPMDLAVEKKQPTNITPFPTPDRSWGEPILDAYAATTRPKQTAVCVILDIDYVEPDVEPAEETILESFTHPAAAGLPVWVEGDSEDIAYPTSAVPKGAKFTVRIAGKSMEPTIPDGAHVFLTRQPDLNNGEIGVFMIGDTSVCKRYHKDENGVQLLSDNPDPKYKPIVITEDTEGFGLVGKYVGHWLPE